MLTSVGHAICHGRSLNLGAATNSGYATVCRAASAITRAPVDMAASFAVLHNGQRHPVKLTPMQKLSQILDTVGEQIHQKLDPAACKLLYNKKQLDLSLPVRFANVPSGSTLELHSGVERKLGILDKPTAVQPASSTAPQEAPNASSAPVTMHNEPSSSAPAPEQLVTQKNSLAAAEAASNQPDPSRKSTKGASGSAQPSSTQQQSTAEAPEHPADAPTEGVDPIGLGRPILLFRREVAAEQADGTAGAAWSTDPDESYYEFTPEDYHRVMAGQQAAKARAESGLRTEKLREQEMQRRAAALGPVPIHVHFQDGLVLQAKFQALEELSLLKQLVQKCLVQGVGSWSLYTTPPKQVLKEYKTSFYKAGLVPAANVYFSTGSEEAKGDGVSCLRKEVLALEGPAPSDRGLSQRQQQEQQRAARPAQAKQTAQSQQGEGSRTRQQDDRRDGSKPVPKWMKLGKK